MVCNPIGPGRDTKLQKNPLPNALTGVIFILAQRVSLILARGVSHTWRAGSTRPGFSTGQDPVMDMVMTLFTSLMALAMQIDGKSSEEALAAATDAAINRTIDLSSLVPDQKQCTLTIRDNDTPVLTIGNTTHAMSTAEMNRLNLALSDSSLTAEQKQQRVASVINGIALSTQMSQNYQQSINTQQSQSETFTR
jgi:hypothetical protein